MSYAQSHGYIVFTNDLDFGTLLAIAKSHLPSVVQVRNQDLLPVAIGDVVISALRQVEEQLELGALVTIDLVCGYEFCRSIEAVVYDTLLLE